MRVVVISAHPDDAEIMAGGLLAREKGIIVVLTDGSLRGDREVRKKESEDAASILGAELVWMGEKDGYIRVTPEIIDSVREILKDVELVVTHSPRDTHRDHRVVREIVLAALRRYPRVSLLYGENTHKLGFAPNVYVDISDYWEVKREALLYHRSQIKTGSLDIELVELTNRLRGKEVGVKYAEGYEGEKVFL